VQTKDPFYYDLRYAMSPVKLALPFRQSQLLKV